MVLVMKTQREIVKFDASNPKHRKDYFEFRNTGSWSHSKFQYDLEFPFDSVPHMCTSKLLDFYLESDKTLK